MSDSIQGEQIWGGIFWREVVKYSKQYVWGELDGGMVGDSLKQHQSFLSPILLALRRVFLKDFFSRGFPVFEPNATANVSQGFFMTAGEYHGRCGSELLKQDLNLHPRGQYRDQIHPDGRHCLLKWFGLSCEAIGACEPSDVLCCVVLASTSIKEKGCDVVLVEEY